MFYFKGKFRRKNLKSKNLNLNEKNREFYQEMNEEMIFRVNGENGLHQHKMTFSVAKRLMQFNIAMDDGTIESNNTDSPVKFVVKTSQI